MRQRSCQTDLHVARVPRGTRAMPVNEKPRVSRGDGFYSMKSAEYLVTGDLVNEIFQIFSASPAFGAGIGSFAEDLKVGNFVFAYSVFNSSACNSAAKAYYIIS